MSWTLISSGSFDCKSFIPFCRLSFCVVTVSFAVQMPLGLIRSHLHIFIFHFFASWFKKNLAVIYVETFQKRTFSSRVL